MMISGVPTPRRSILATVVALLVICPILGIAQQIPQLPSTAAPGALEREKDRPQELPSSDKPLRPIDAPMPGQTPPAGAASTYVDVQSIEITGNKALSSDSLLASSHSLFGTKISLARLYGVAADVTSRYRAAGYILSSAVVPPQDLGEHVFHLRVIEGYVSNVTIEGNLGQRRGIIEAIRRKLLKDRPLRASTLERCLLALNDVSGTTAQAFVVASPHETGASDVIIRLSTHTFSAYLAASNRGSRLQGPNQYEAGVSLNSILGLAENTSVDYLQASRREELKYYSISHTERLSPWGWSLSLGASKSNATPDLGVQLNELNLATDTREGHVAMLVPIYRSRESSLYLRSTLSYLNASSDTPLFVISHDRISSLRVGLSWDNIDAARGITRFDFETSHGIRAFGASAPGDPLASRAGGRPDYTKETLYLARLQSLGGGFAALLALSGQYAFNRLLAPEEFAFGGEYFGRAYDLSELVGSSGIAAKIELRYSVDIRANISATLYGFGESGHVWRRLAGGTSSPDVAVSPTDHATDIGAGVRLGITRWITGYVEVAKPTDHNIAVFGDRRTRIFGGLRASM